MSGLRTASIARSTASVCHTIQQTSPLISRFRTMASVASAPRKEGKAFFSDEPDGPSLKSEIPGPKSKELIKELDRVFDTRSLNMMADYDKSVGN